MAVTKKVAARNAPQIAKKPPVVVQWFRNWLDVKDEGAILADRQDDLRLRLLETVAANGEEDEKGNIFLELPEPVEFENNEGKKFIYVSLKRERRLTPANPTPDPAKAVALLKKKKLWLDENQQKLIQELQISCPFAVVNVSLDVNALEKAYFSEQISEKEYEACLKEQKESFAFHPCER